MKKRLTIITCLMMICSFMFGQQSAIWGDVNKSSDGLNATATIEVQIDGVTQENTNLQIGVFYGDDLYGLGTISYKFGKYLSMFTIYGNNGYELTFKLYNPETATEYTSDFSWTFVANNALGSARNPQVINFYGEASLEGAGTVENPYLIKDMEDLVLFRDKVNSGDTKYNAPGVYVALDADIDMTGVNWVGIGSATADHGFMGNFDGKNYKIQNLTITNPALDADGYAYAGLFSVTEGTDKDNQNVIKNLTIENVTINTAGHITAAAIAYPYYTVVENVTVCGNIAITGGDYTSGALAYTRRTVDARNITVAGNEGSYITGRNTVGGVISDIQMNGGLTANYSNFNASGVTVTGVKSVGGISGIIAGQTLNGCTVDNVTLNCTDSRVGVVAGSLGSTATISNAVVGTVTGATAIVGANFDTGKAVQARIGDVYYSTLEGAYVAVKAGQTITLINNAQGGGIVINKSITIDFNTCTYTFSELGVGSGSLTSNGFQILKGNNVTLKNGTLQVAEAMKENYYILVQNYANLNVENMTLDGTNLDKWSTVEDNWDSYTLSNNSGNVNIVNTKIIANNEGAKAFAFDVCKKESYTAPIVTLDASSVITGKVELSGGQFHPEQGVTVSLTKEIDPYDLVGWYTISAPFATNFVYNVTEDDDYTLFRYDEKKAVWENHKKHNFGIEVGRGYLYANLQGNDLTLEGVANIADYTTTLKYESEVEELKGNHLLGNPYTFDITGEHLVGNIEGGFYQMAGNGAWIPCELTEEIAVGEGFLVQAVAETSFAINKTKTAATRSANNGSLQINVANDVYSDVAYASFNEGIGLSKIEHQNANIPMVYIPVENNDYAIAYLGENVEEIPFSFEAKTMGTYTISVKAQNCEFSTMTLVDRFTGVETNLLFEDYSFVAKSSDNSDRFILKLSRGTTDLEEEHFAYINNNGLIINNASGNATLQIFDVMGRPVSSHNVSGNANIAMESLTNGVYILRLIDDNNVRIQKVVID